MKSCINHIFPIYVLSRSIKISTAKYYIQNYDGKYYVPELGLKKKQLKHVDKHFCSYKPKR